MRQFLYRVGYMLREVLRQMWFSILGTLVSIWMLLYVGVDVGKVWVVVPMSVAMAFSTILIALLMHKEEE